MIYVMTRNIYGYIPLQPPPNRDSHCITLLPEAVRHWLIRSFLGLLIVADVLAAAAHARFTLLFALVQALLLYYLYTPPGGDKHGQSGS
jgi:hypothetical protein